MTGTSVTWTRFARPEFDPGCCAAVRPEAVYRWKFGVKLQLTRGSLGALHSVSHV